MLERSNTSKTSTARSDDAATAAHSATAPPARRKPGRPKGARDLVPRAPRNSGGAKAIKKRKAAAEAEARAMVEQAAMAGMGYQIAGPSRIGMAPHMAASPYFDPRYQVPPAAQPAMAGPYGYQAQPQYQPGAHYSSFTSATMGYAEPNASTPRRLPTQHGHGVHGSSMPEYGPLQDSVHYAVPAATSIPQVRVTRPSYNYHPVTAFATPAVAPESFAPSAQVPDNFVTPAPITQLGSEMSQQLMNPLRHMSPLPVTNTLSTGAPFEIVDLPTGSPSDGQVLPHIPSPLPDTKPAAGVGIPDATEDVLAILADCDWQDFTGFDSTSLPVPASNGVATDESWLMAWTDEGFTALGFDMSADGIDLSGSMPVATHPSAKPPSDVPAHSGVYEDHDTVASTADKLESIRAQLVLNAQTSNTPSPHSTPVVGGSVTIPSVQVQLPSPDQSESTLPLQRPRSASASQAWYSPVPQLDASLNSTGTSTPLQTPFESPQSVNTRLPSSDNSASSCSPEKAGYHPLREAYVPTPSSEGSATESNGNGKRPREDEDDDQAKRSKLRIDSDPGYPLTILSPIQAALDDQTLSFIDEFIRETNKLTPLPYFYDSPALLRQFEDYVDQFVTQQLSPFAGKGAVAAI